MRRKKATDKKVRVTLDLSPPFYERLEQLERMVDAGTKANVIRQAQASNHFAYNRLAISIRKGDR